MINERQRSYGSTKEIDIDTLISVFNSEKFKYVKLAVLFGSRASGSAHKRSDYDFALLLEEDDALAWGIVSKAWSDIGSELGLKEIDYDVVDMSRLTAELKSSIKESYIVLKGDADDISRLLA